ncbi:TraR/DksA family transcriptional regulator [Micromonospora sp. DR5-3]|uniref:TraR/DksA family transcriptional regulator n=1 Tax=unclassified Micromonospora TaxID=2617518 RepID=UPI0011D5B0F9|nr:MULTISPECIES: TraR/DksA family transcriptional regulator [unclassified Micromonospora]MCW3817393.1 TraR/DksA family transcriptional regulator [Micromonospora sp. DR5-3]TYC19378.1 conjugal transfer protein TraR [Micromonospora sp. MP36]
MTDTLSDRAKSLRDILERQFEEHTGQLTALTAHAREPGHGGYDPDTLRGLMETARQGIADTAAALRRMAEGSYGSCESCSGEIPVARLEILPWARHCVPCQQKQRV